MASGRFESSTGYNLDVGCEWSSTPNAATNKSSVRVRVYLKHYQIYCGALSGSYVTVGDSTQYFTASVSSSSGGLQKTYIADKTFTVSHLSDGSKSVKISVGWAFNGSYNGHYFSTVTSSKTVTLDKIARASSFSAPATMTLGSAATVSVSAASSAYTHRVVLTVGSAVSSGTIVSGSSISVTPPASLAEGMTSETSKSGTVTLETYSGSTKIGETSKSCTFVVPATSEYLPTFTLSFTPSSTSSFITSRGIVAAKLSSGTVSVTGSAARHGASVSATKVSFGSKRQNGSSLSTGALSAGTFTYSATVTDSRGHSATKSGSVTVLPYFEPFADSAQVFRCDATGDPDDEGEYLSVYAESVYAPLSGANSASLSLAVSRRTGQSVGTWSLTSGSRAVIPAALSAVNSYYAVITATDLAGSTSTHRTVIPTSKVDIHMKNGRIRFGGYVERDGFECDYPARFSGGVSVGDDEVGDVVVESGTSGIWTWRKWASGASECYGTTPVQRYALSETYGAFRQSSQTAGESENSVAYPAGLFIAAPTVSATPARVAYAVMIAPRSAGTAAASPNYYVIYPVTPSGGELDAAIHLSVHGRWKQ